MRRTFISMIGAFLLLAGVAVAQQPGGAEQEARAIGLFRALKSGAPDSVVAYLESNAAPNMWTRRDRAAWRDLATRLIADLGQRELAGVVISGPQRLRLQLERQGEMGATLGFEFEPSPPHLIAGLGVDIGGGPDEGPPLPPLEISPGAERADIAAGLKRFVDQLAGADRFSGTVLVAYQGDVVYSAAHGMASKRFAVPNTLATRFDLGSINKSFTQIAVGQLLQAAQLSLEDRISDRLPDYPDQAVAQRITIRQLLNHTSGLGDMFTERFRRSSSALYRMAA